MTSMTWYRLTHGKPMVINKDLHFRNPTYEYLLWLVYPIKFVYLQPFDLHLWWIFRSFPNEKHPEGLIQTWTGWWFGTFPIFSHSVWNVIIPTDELICFRGVDLTTNHIHR